MPSQAIKPSQTTPIGMTGVRNNDTWTDDLPICKLSGVGMSANQMYREDGTPCSEHEYEDRSIHFCLDKENGIYLYGVFDGHDSARAAYFASQRMPAELSFEQLVGKTVEGDVKEVFRDAFLAVENAFLESIDPKIAERTQLLDKIPDAMSQFEAAQKFPDVVNRLQILEQEIRGGTTAVVALIHGGVLYVGNMGDSRALLCKKDSFGVLRVRQLTADHTTNSEDELQRLSSLGLDVSKMRDDLVDSNQLIADATRPGPAISAKMGSHLLTRCIGNYFVKGGYKEFDILSNATSEPVIAEPHITSVPIDDSCSFLLLMSDGLYKSYQEATNSDQVNKEIAQMVVEQFVEQPTLTSVAQTVVDKVVRLHHDVYLTRQSNITTRDDITLIIRNFNFQLRGAVLPSVPQHSPRARARAKPRARDVSPSSSSSDDQTLCDDLSALPQHLAPEGRYPHHNTRHMQRHHNFSIDEESTVPSMMLHTGSNTTSTESSDLANPSLTQFSLDEDGRIHPYVSFDQYWQSIEEAKAQGLIPESQLQHYK